MKAMHVFLVAVLVLAAAAVPAAGQSAATGPGSGGEKLGQGAADWVDLAGRGGHDGPRGGHNFGGGRGNHGFQGGKGLNRHGAFDAGKGFRGQPGYGKHHDRYRYYGYRNRYPYYRGGLHVPYYRSYCYGPWPFAPYFGWPYQYCYYRR